MHRSTLTYPAPRSELTGQHLISHAGLSAVGGLLNAVDLRALCEDRFSQFVPKTASHRPGKIMADLAMMLAAGGEQACDVDLLRTSPGVFGPIASEATVSRFMGRIKHMREAITHGYQSMNKTLRSRLWAATGDRNPAKRATRANPLILDIDATLVQAHSDKQGAAGTYKGGYGFAPMIATADYGQGQGTGEILAVLLRPGNKGANSAKDHIEALSQALEVLPDDFYDQHGVLIGEKLLVRTDSAGASREFLNHLDSLGLQFTTSYSLPVLKEREIRWISDKKYWEPAIDQHGRQLRDVWVVDATRILQLKDYPPNTRICVRAEPLHSGAKASLFDADGNRITAFLTNSPYYNIPELDRRHRARGRCENRIKSLKHAGLGKLPYWSFAANQAWALLAGLAVNLLAWVQLVVLPAGHEASVWDLKRWRYRLFSLAGKLIRSGRQTRLLIPKHAPEAGMFTIIEDACLDLQQRWRQGHLTA
ncbi:IS1380 family transposase [Glutamicibacter creatinolyticus]|uniref:IS1380 family transposase n=1 Tax=Glutamicibacter creatinolyticus TaxID=162496 RepID=UPI00321776B3